MDRERDSAAQFGSRVECYFRVSTLAGADHRHEFSVSGERETYKQDGYPLTGLKRVQLDGKSMNSRSGVKSLETPDARVNI